MSDGCCALAEGTVETLPVKAKKVAISQRYFVYIWLFENPHLAENATSATEVAPKPSSTDKTLSKPQIPLDGVYTWIHRRGKGDIWQGLYEPLLLEFPAPPTAEELLQHPTLQPLLQQGATLQPLVSGLTHQLTHRKLQADSYALWGDFSKAFDLHQEWRDKFIRISWTERENYAFPRLVHLIVERFS